MRECSRVCSHVGICALRVCSAGIHCWCCSNGVTASDSTQNGFSAFHDRVDKTAACWFDAKSEEFLAIMCDLRTFRCDLKVIDTMLSSL